MQETENPPPMRASGEIDYARLKVMWLRAEEANLKAFGYRLGIYGKEFRQKTMGWKTWRERIRATGREEADGETMRNALLSLWIELTHRLGLAIEGGADADELKRLGALASTLKLVHGGLDALIGLEEPDPLEPLSIGGINVEKL